MVVMIVAIVCLHLGFHLRIFYQAKFVQQVQSSLYLAECQVLLLKSEQKSDRTSVRTGRKNQNEIEEAACSIRLHEDCHE